MPHLPDALLAVAARQHGVVSRAQALQHLTRAAIRWLLETRTWLRVSPGIYRTHAGPLTWEMRAHAALLHAGKGAALTGASAGYIHGMIRKAPPIITVGVPAERRVRRVPGVRVQRRRELTTTVVAGFSVTDAASTVLDMADDPLWGPRDVVALVADGVRTDVVTAADLAAALTARRAHRFRRVVQLAIGDVADGAESVLEVMVLRDVIRAHGLPPMTCQVPDTTPAGRLRRDFENEEYGVVLEADGTEGHEGSGRIADLRRDRKAAARGRVTLRIGWVDAHLDPHDVALDLHGTYTSRGYSGDIQACGPDCTVQRWRREIG